MTNWFQTNECFEFYSSLSFLEPFKYEIKQGDEVKGRIVGYIQKDGSKIMQFFSRRAIINGGPMLAEDISNEEIQTLLSICKTSLKNKVIYVESRNFIDYSRHKELFQDCGWFYEPHYNFHIDTSSSEIVETHLGRSRKRDIRTSLRAGATFGEAESIDEVKKLYLILERLYTKKIKTPLFPWEFFEKLYYASWGKIFVVRFEGRIVGGTVCVCGKETVYEWFACGEDGLTKNVFPSTLATYSGIKYAEENGAKRFDMMGAGAPDDGGYGVRDFKAKFGGEMVEHGRFRCILNKPLFFIGKLGVTLIKKFK